jgi:SAM-dependent methyltransferase
MQREHRDANLKWWNESASIHARSAFYDLDGFVAGKRTGLHPTEPSMVGDVTGKSLVQLQCHLGIETLAWARLGAARVVGLDFAPDAIREARALAARCELEDRATFVLSDVHDSASKLGTYAPFDIVYVSVGATIWLPSIRAWAAVCASLVKPGGILFLREAHPMLLATVREEGKLVLKNKYFEHEEPNRWEDTGTYADRDATLSQTVTYEWNRGLGDIVQAIVDAGFTLELLTEHRDAEWQAFPEMTRDENGLYRLPPHERELLPLTFSLRARKTG